MKYYCNNCFETWESEYWGTKPCPFCGADESHVGFASEIGEDET